MTDAPPYAEPVLQPATGVVLLAPELFETPPSPTGLVITMATVPSAGRMLVSASDPVHVCMAESLARQGVSMQILASAGMAMPETTLPFVQMPPGTSDEETNELALALSDYVLIVDETIDRPLAKRALDLKKTFVMPGAKPLPPLRQHNPVSHCLDPARPGLHRSFRWLSGRVEQFGLELAAFNWLGCGREGIQKSFDAMSACIGIRKHIYDPYFAPEFDPEKPEDPYWQKLCPDPAAIAADSPIVEAFERLDRSAKHGSFIHRDFAWLTHLAAALAVFCAVAGYIHLWFEEEHWGKLEFATLAFILAATVFSLSFRLQDRWTACRYAAEQLRIARLCIPLLVVPSALAGPDRSHLHDESERSMAEVKRAVRDQGLPIRKSALSPREAARWLHLIVTDQHTYHHKNRHKLHCAEDRLNLLTIILFLLAFGMVTGHLLNYKNELALVATAAAPAFAAALHGLTTRLGLVHRIHLSQDATLKLHQVIVQLDRMLSPGAIVEWQAVRRLAREADKAMAGETAQWHSQVRRSKDGLT